MQLAKLMLTKKFEKLKNTINSFKSDIALDKMWLKLISFFM